MKAHFRTQQIKDIFIVVSSEGAAEDEDVYEIVREMESGNPKVYFGITTGNTILNPAQRKYLIDAVHRITNTTMVLTDSIITRMLVTSASWIIPGLKTYSLSDLKKALDSIKMTDDTRRMIEANIPHMISACRESHKWGNEKKVSKM